MSSTLDVNSAELKPSQHFVDFMRTLDVSTDESEAAVLGFWAD